MTKRIGRTLIIQDESPQQFDDRGKIAELRPYGPGGSMNCHNCALKDEEGTKRRFQRMMLD